MTEFAKMSMFHTSNFSIIKPVRHGRYRAQNSGLSQVIFRPTSAYDRVKSNLIGQVLLYISNGEANDSP